MSQQKNQNSFDGDDPKNENPKQNDDLEQFFQQRPLNSNKEDEKEDKKSDSEDKKSDSENSNDSEKSSEINQELEQKMNLLQQRYEELFTRTSLLMKLDKKNKRSKTDLERSIKFMRAHITTKGMFNRN